VNVRDRPVRGNLMDELQNWPMGTFVVTGAGSGIGSAIVAELRQREHEVVRVVRQRTDDGIVLDLAEPATFEAALPAFDSLDGLVHCAAVGDVATVAETTLESWQRTLTVNVIAVAELTRLLLPALRRAHGHLLFIGASRGIHGAPGWAAHAASKEAMRFLADALRQEEPNLHVTTVYPGATATPLLRKLREQGGRPYEPDRYLTPEAVAEVVADCLTRGSVTDVYL
jgi:NAD(P)-dependent dehydrogenase (short-subunit alcohol dehydrogenase family)